ncbi:hypothetical protein NIES208_02345 [[Limnothrix rosea] IAM M-220]|nr:hypothetical protein NIES208_02345 [[Limnothrix rosea] IAM M-220]
MTSGKKVAESEFEKRRAKKQGEDYRRRVKANGGFGAILDCFGELIRIETAGQASWPMGW